MFIYIYIYIYIYQVVLSLIVLRSQTHQEDISSIISTPSTSSTPFYEGCQARHFKTHIKHTIS